MDSVERPDTRTSSVSVTCHQRTAAMTKRCRDDEGRGGQPGGGSALGIDIERREFITADDQQPREKACTHRPTRSTRDEAVRDAHSGCTPTEPAQCGTGHSARCALPSRSVSRGFAQ